MSSSDFDVVQLGTAEVDPGTGLPVVQAVNPAGDDEEDVEHYGKVDFACALGITTLPWPKDEKGAAEGVILRSCGGTDGLCVGGRDERCAKAYANLSKGDACLHSVDPEASAQVQAKANRIVGMYTKDSNGDNMAIAADGKNGKVQIAAFGAIIEITPDKLVITEPSGKASIMMENGAIMLVGKVILGGITPTLNIASGLQASITAVPPVLLAAPNVWVSAV